IPDHALACGGTEKREQNELVVGIAEEAVAQRLLGTFALRLELLEYRRFLQLEADVNRDQQKRNREPERNAPAPAREGRGLHVEAAAEDDEEREQHADGRRGLNP